MLTGKSIVIGVTGSIAAYKIANLASMLVKLNADVHVIMTQNATHFITPMTFETLTNNKCIVDTFDRNFNFDVKHVSLARRRATSSSWPLVRLTLSERWQMASAMICLPLLSWRRKPPCSSHQP